MKRVYDVVSIKTAVVEGENRQWFNVYPVDGEKPFIEPLLKETTEKILVAESFQQLPHVKQEMVVCCPAWEFDFTDDLPPLYCFSAGEYNNRLWNSGQAPLPFNWIYVINRVPRLGKTARFNLQQALYRSDVVEFPDGRSLLARSDWTGNLALEYYESYLLECPLKHLIAHRIGDGRFADGGSEVIAFTHGSLGYHRSIEDAQRRKTAKADSYRFHFEQKLSDFSLVVKTFRELIRDYEETVPDEKIAQMFNLLQPISATFSALLDYWEEGIKPFPVIEYRPLYSGLDPHSQACRSICEKMIDLFEALTVWTDENIVLGGGGVPTVIVESFMRKVWPFVVAYVRIWQWLRFTGTPTYNGVPVVVP